MRYTTFGRRTGLRVSEYALGTGNFGTGWASGADRDESRRMLERFAEAGGTFIDTADSYQYGESETLLGEFLANSRDQLVLASKFSRGVDRAPALLSTGNSRRAIVTALEASLRRLRTDYLDLYWVHFPDFVTPIDEIVTTLDDLVRQGKILHAGLSNFPAWRVARGVTLAELRGTNSLVGVQFEYSLAVRDGERDLLPMAEGLGLGVALYSPLGGGLLTGKYRQSQEGRLTTLGRIIQREDTAQKTAVVDALLTVAEQLDSTPARVAMAWLLRRARLVNTAAIPIIGPRTLAQLEDYLAALDLQLTDEQYDQLTQVGAPVLGVPHETGAESAGWLLGGVADRFDRLGPVA